LNEVAQPIICSPYEEPGFHWYIEEGKPCDKRAGRRPSVYYYRPPARGTGSGEGSDIGEARELRLVNEIRERVKVWRNEGYPGIGRTTFELLQYWKRDGRQKRLFFCQFDAVETIIFLIEGRADLKERLEIPTEEIPENTRWPNGSDGAEYRGFIRYALKMATGTGKTMVMGLVAAWSILNKVNDRSDSRFSDLIFVVCPSITIRERLAELDPNNGESSIYRIWDIVPPHLMDKMRSGRVIITNWHVLEPRDGNQVGGTGAKVVNKGKESDTAFIRRVLGRSGASKQNIVIFNDEAHHAYRLFQERPDNWDEMTKEEKDEWLGDYKEATVWIDGLDRINRGLGINFCLDLSATPYFLNRTGNEANTPFPWIVSDFSLVDSIESGLVKIPQLPIRDTTGEEIPAFFNVWRWIIPKLTPKEKGGKKLQPRPEAILKYADMPIKQLAGLWLEKFHEWSNEPDIYPTPPVFIIVSRNIKLARMIYEWIADDSCPTGITSFGISELRNTNGETNTIRVDSKVILETDVESSKDDEKTKMRFVLDTIGKTAWPNNEAPQRWIELAEKLDLPVMIPPGRDIRCVVSVAMLTEGWDCKTVTHIVGLRPFMSQLLCEQVVGRGLRRSVYDPDENGLMPEEISKVYGVPFEIIPYKTNPQGPVPRPPKIHHIKAISPDKDRYEIRFPLIEGYCFAIKNRVWVDWENVPNLLLDPSKIPPEVEVKSMNVNNRGRLSLSGPGKTDEVTLQQWRQNNRLQALKFDMAKALTKDYSGMPGCEIPSQELFSQMLSIVNRFHAEKVIAPSGHDIKDVFLSPYYGWAIEILVQAIRPDTDSGETPEMPIYEKSRPYGSTFDVDLWTSRPVREVVHSHLNYVVADTKRWEQSVAYYLDKHKNVEAFVKNSGLGFAIPYLHNGQPHDYIPDFLVKLKYKDGSTGMVILEVKGFDPLQEIKKAAALRWLKAVNAEGSYGHWKYAIVSDPVKTNGIIVACIEGYIS